MTHDFDEAILTHEFIQLAIGTPDRPIEDEAKRKTETVLFALKFTKAALSGEVSDEVMKAATDSYSINGRFALLSHYKAMCQQLAKEIG